MEGIPEREVERIAGNDSAVLKEILVRVVIGGVVVSAFAMLGDVFEPKSFAGLFGATPAIALATLALTVGANGASYAAVEARSMIGGAMAFFVYASMASHLMMRYKLPALRVTCALIPIWMAAAFGLWAVWLR
jgi:hypothetical protein